MELDYMFGYFEKVKRSVFNLLIIKINYYWDVL